MKFPTILLALAISLVISVVARGAEAPAQCERYNKMVDLTTKTLAITLNCKNEMSIRTDVDKMGMKLGMCKAAEDKGLVCTVVGKAGVYMVRRQIPAYWLCKPDIAMKVLEMGLIKTCESLTGL